MQSVKDRIQVSEKLTAGPHPAREDIHHLADIGFRSVINLCMAEEKSAPMDPKVEEKEAKASNLEYVHLPVNMNELQPELVDRFRAKLRELPYPIYVHCASGKRACAFSLMHVAAEDGWSGEDTLERGEEIGFHCDVKDLRDFITEYVEHHRHD